MTLYRIDFTHFEVTEHKRSLEFESYNDFTAKEQAVKILSEYNSPRNIQLIYIGEVVDFSY